MTASPTQLEPTAGAADAAASLRRRRPGDVPPTAMDEGQPTSAGTGITNVSAKGAPPPPPSRWFTLEYAIYIGFLAYLLWTLTPYCAHELDRVCLNGTTPACEHGLHPGWLGDRKIDLTDRQWHDFRQNLPLLTGVAIAFLGLSHAVRRFVRAPRSRMWFYAAVAVAFLALAYGAHALFILLLVFGSYALGAVFGRSRLLPAATWLYALAVLLGTDRFHDWITFQNLLGPSFAWLDDLRGLYAWHLGFNLVTLRMISFNLDRYWSLQAAASGASVPAGQPTEDDYDSRVTTPLPASLYTPASYIAYVFYVPLHLAGPILPANAFLSQVNAPPTRLSIRDGLVQFVRLVFALLIMESMLHYMYAYAVATSGAFRGFGPLEVGLLGYFSLHLIWLKFLIIWRFFRLWAYCDNIETVENMNRCMSNNYNLQGFWRSWHRSFNRWLIRYIYVPIGGKHSRLLSTFAVFTFTALWHDLQLRLLAWGWAIAVFIVPEMTLAAYFGQPKMKAVRTHWTYRHLCALGGAVNIFFMMVVNLVGFSVGLEGIQSYLATVFSSRDSVVFLLGTLATFFSATQIMFEVRATEARRSVAKHF